MSLRLALLRHGHTDWNRAHRLQGRTDIPLDDMARADLAKLSLPPPWDACPVYASPLTRARQTAEALGQRPEIADPLIEMDWGAWEGQYGTALRADPSSGYRDIEEWGWDYRPPSGESPAELRARLDPWLRARTEDAVVITHIGVMRVALALATGWGFRGPCPFTIKRNCLYVIDYDAQRWHLHAEPVRLIARGS